jgi:hypothetical protein
MRNDKCIQLTGKPEAKVSLGRPRGRLEDNITMELKEIGCGLD